MSDPVLDSAAFLKAVCGDARALPAARRIDRAVDPLRRARWPGHAAAVVSLAALAGACALQGPYVAPISTADGTRLASAGAPVSSALAAGPPWWTALEDPAVNRLVEQSLLANASLDRAVAAMDEARALARVSRADQVPALGFEGAVSHERVDPAAAGGDQTLASAGLALAWEVDLFGRVRNGVAASRYRLEARTAEAHAVRLALVADVADAVAGLRACDASVVAIAAEIASRRTVHALTVQRRDAGFDADVDVALAGTGLANAETTLALRRQDCAGIANTLVVLTGASREAIAEALRGSSDQPGIPPLPTRLPAGLLRSSPGVIAAERDAAAAWADIAVARAERMPRLDLTAALTGRWLEALGSTSDSVTSVRGAGLAAPLFDGGRGGAAVAAGEARYAAAVADLDAALREAGRDVQNALAAAASARTRTASARRAFEAATVTLRAREAQWRAGAVSQFEVEDARRQVSAARDSMIGAARDAVQAWVALVRAAGPDVLLQEVSS